MIDSHSARGSALGRLFGGASVAALSLAVLLPASALAQEATTTAPAAGAAAPAPAANAQGTELQTVVVTGSRIQRKDYTSNSPIVTLGSQNLMSQSDLQIQDTLNKLPQFTADQNLMGANTVDVQATPNHSIGISTASLRGLGPNRNLVLIDGQRGAPVNGEGVVDLSTIPQSMIDHVEFMTGGASAVYGPDAIGGVVNFIMKRNFHGMDVDVQEGINQTGDGKQFQASMVMGTNFADDKGNITVALERFEQDASYQRDHSWFTKGYNDPTLAGNGFFPFGTAADPTPTAAAIAQVFGSAAAAHIPTSSYFWFNNGQLFTGNSGFGGATPIYGAAPTPNGTTIANVNALANGQTITELKDNETIGYLQSPLSRWSMFANGHYDINEWVTAEFQANFSQTETNTVLTAPASFITGWTVNVPYNMTTDSPVLADGVTPNPNYIAPGQPGAQHPVPTQLAILLNSRAGGATTPWNLSWLPSLNGPLPTRGSQDTNQVFQIRAGLRGKLPDFGTLDNWTWSLSGSHSDSQEYVVAQGDYSLQRFQALITSADYGQGQTLKGNLTQPNGSGGTTLSPNFGFGLGSGVTCTSGFYNTLFNNGPLSSDCYADMAAPAQNMNITKQDNVEYDMSGDLFKLPAGTVKGSIGADYRRVSLVYNPDILQSDQSFIDEVVGVYPTTYVNASQDVKEGYGEVDIPILADLPFVKSFVINPGIRYSSYNTSKIGTWTWKAEGHWAVNDWLNFRGSYNVAVRSPNIGELFEGPTEFFGAGSSYADACSLLSNAPWGAGGARPTAQGQTGAVVNTAGAAGAQNAYAVCRALMGATGATQFYDTPTGAPQGTTASVFAWNEEEGSTNLQPETARTYTGGIVIKSPFDNPLVQRLQLSIDYYKIHITDAIEYASVDYVYQNCLDQPAATALNSPYCQAIVRSAQTGAAGTTTVPEANLATIDTSGVDLQLDWSVALADIWKNAPGRFSLNETATFLGNYDTIAYPGAPTERWYGTFGPTLAGLDGGAFAYRLNTSFGYSVGPAIINLNWRHYPRINAASSVTPGNLTLPTNAYDVFDLNSIWSLPHGLQLRAGISNLFDVAPPITAATTAGSFQGIPTSLASSGVGSTNASFYDVLGRRFYIAIKARF